MATSPEQITSEPPCAPNAAIMDRLRDETRSAHDQVEGLPFSERLVEQTLPLASYIAQLHAWHTVHAHLERLLDEHLDARGLDHVWHDERRKTPWLTCDIEALDPGAQGMSPRVQAHAKRWCEHLDEAAAQHPLALLGHLYVLEGSTLGGMVLRKHLAEQFDLNEHSGLRYHSAYGRQTAPMWRTFKEAMNRAVVTPGLQAHVIEQACAAFEHVASLLKVLSEELPAPSK